MDSETLLTIYAAVWLGVLGAVLGSFLDCAAARYAAGGGWLPRGRSRCDACGHILGAADLIPVVSWLLRRGRCRYCGAKIPADCLWAELGGAALFAGLTVRFGLTAELAMWLLLGAALLALALVDGRTHEIPNGILLFAAAVRLAFLPLMDVPVLEQLAGMAVGALSVSAPLLVLSLVMDKALGRESLGGGDLKLLFVLGLYMRWPEMLLLLLLDCLLALVWALLPGRDRRREIAFGPFLAAAWALTVLFGDGLIQWYQSLFVF